MVFRRVGRAPGEARAHHDQVSQVIQSEVTKPIRVGSMPKSLQSFPSQGDRVVREKNAPQFMLDASDATAASAAKASWSSIEVSTICGRNPITW